MTKKVNDFWNLIPLTYLYHQAHLKPNRSCELAAEYRMIFKDKVGNVFLGTSINFTAKEQQILDCEIETMQFGFEGEIVRQLVIMVTGYTEKDVKATLKRIEAKCLYRDILEIDPIPRRKTSNIYDNYWNIFFSL